MTNFCLLLFLLGLFLACKPSPSTKMDGQIENKDSLSLINTTPKLDSSKKNITEVNYLPLPFGDSSILEFDKIDYNTLIIPDERNTNLEENIYSFNAYYDFGVNTSTIGNEVIPNFDSNWIPSLSYYDVEINSNLIQIAHDSIAILKKIKLPNQEIYLGYCDLNNNKEKKIHRTYNLYSYDSIQNKILHSLNIYYSVNLNYNYNKSKYKNFTTGYVNKFFYLHKSGILNLYYFDYKYAGEGEEYEYLRKEDWIIKKNGKFVRYYDDNGLFKNEEEQGVVQNNMREGKWIEKKPNALVNKPTYLEGYYKEGEPIGEWRFYIASYDTLTYKDGFYTREKYTFREKGVLLYIETYEDGNLVQRKFVE